MWLNTIQSNKKIILYDLMYYMHFFPVSWSQRDSQYVLVKYIDSGREWTLRGQLYQVVNILMAQKIFLLEWRAYMIPRSAEILLPNSTNGNFLNLRAELRQILAPIPDLTFSGHFQENPVLSSLEKTMGKHKVNCSVPCRFILDPTCLRHFHENSILCSLEKPWENTR